MSEPMSDADRIRNKRLAKLQQQQQQTETKETQPSESQPLAPHAEKAAEHDTTTRPSPVTSPGPPRRITITPQKREMNGVERTIPHPAESDEQWTDRTLRNIFRLTLEPSENRDANGHSLHQLPALKQELLDEGQDVRITIDNLEQAIMEAGGQDMGRLTPHDWLFACWKRVTKMAKGFRDKSPENVRFSVLQEAQRLCMSWCLFSVTTPEVFNAEYDGTHAFADHLIADPEDERGVCADFLQHAIPRLEDDDSVKAIFIGAVEELSRRLSRMTMDSDYRTFVTVLRTLMQYPALVATISQSEKFCDKTIPAAELEVKTLLGPFFQLSPLQAATTQQYFPGPKTMDPGRIRNAQQSMQMALRTHQEELFAIIDSMVRKSPEARDKILDWFALVVNANHKRKAMRVDKTTVSSDGFMININVVLDRLSEPFIDARFSKLDRVDIDYLRRNPRIEIEDETKVNADLDESKRFYETKLEGKNNFISEVFFLAVSAHHYGTEAARSMLKDMERELKHMSQQIEQFETERHKYVNNPQQLQLFENALKRYKEQYDKGLSYKYAVSGVLTDEIMLTRSMQFTRFMSAWVLRQVSENREYPAKKLRLPLPEPTEGFKNLPEYVLDVIRNNFGFIIYNAPQVISPTQSDELIELCIAFLSNSGHIRNPYLKSGFVTILFRGTWSWRQGDRGILTDQYNGMPFALENMLHALMKFFIEAEFMGGHGQFFDKFNVRYEIFQIIKCIWPNRVYRDKLLKEAKVNQEFFIRFVNLLLNDVTFVLDESFTAFHSIHDLTKELESGGTTLDEEGRRQKEEALEAAKGKAKSYMQLTNETVHIMKLFTEALADAFTMPEIVQRLADMLDYNLEAMVPPKSSSLNVDNLSDYNFRPRELLSDIVGVYLNLSKKDNFILAVARDGRSYKPKNFASASTVLSKYSLKSNDEMLEWSALIERIASTKAEDDAADADLGEIPDEFLDPLMYTLMEDPVILPISKTIIDRSTIRSHLLSDPHDPFNRVPLKIEDVMPADEIREKIRKFKEEKIGGRKKDFVETIRTEDAMDTT